MKCLPERGLADVPSPPDTDSCGRSTEGGRTTALEDPIKNLNIANQSNEHFKFVTLSFQVHLLIVKQT
jgi:hypothetical protein